ncbi:hypothetical protein LT85_1901 [Collimonas arenae]|uniref:Uncharacterized protein n=1 Tax=Collimonas arenae TaxID=279058 RepID=A0A0A1FBK4_9BURK|nr:hypothetical protein LT85_1901 [Collimonas arenae]
MLLDLPEGEQYSSIKKHLFGLLGNVKIAQISLSKALEQFP